MIPFLQFNVLLCRCVSERCTVEERWEWVILTPTYYLILSWILKSTLIFNKNMGLVYKEWPHKYLVWISLLSFATVSVKGWRWSVEGRCESVLPEWCWAYGGSSSSSSPSREKGMGVGNLWREGVSLCFQSDAGWTYGASSSSSSREKGMGVEMICGRRVWVCTSRVMLGELTFPFPLYPPFIM